MLEAIGVVLLAMLIVAICTALYLKQKKRELADLANLENLANGEYMNRSKAERFLFAKQKTYPTEAEYSSEYSVQETPGIYTRGISSKKLNSINKINENFIELSHEILDKPSSKKLSNGVSLIAKAHQIFLLKTISQ
ncbi:hypothetical protein [Candidatus Spongiihabitans sp.]|uniref:hypothetical protein n=1 Tax=Candidatus Spongiihabitans sp. TaxID=3101308 RepID=UPI003C6ED9E2